MAGSLYGIDDPKGYRKKSRSGKTGLYLSVALLVLSLVLIWRTVSLGGQVKSKTEALATVQLRFDQQKQELERWQLSINSKDKTLQAVQRNFDRVNRELDIEKKNTRTERDLYSKCNEDLGKTVMKVNQLEHELAEEKHNVEVARHRVEQLQMDQEALRRSTHEREAALHHRIGDLETELNTYRGSRPTPVGDRAPILTPTYPTPPVPVPSQQETAQHHTPLQQEQQQQYDAHKQPVGQGYNYKYHGHEQDAHHTGDQWAGHQDSSWDGHHGDSQWNTHHGPPARYPPPQQQHYDTGSEQHQQQQRYDAGGQQHQQGAQQGQQVGGHAQQQYAGDHGQSPPPPGTQDYYPPGDNHYDPWSAHHVWDYDGPDYHRALEDYDWDHWDHAEHHGKTDTPDAQHGTATPGTPQEGGDRRALRPEQGGAQEHAHHA